MVQSRPNIASALNWDRRLLPEQWALYRAVLEGAVDRGIPFAIGGGLAFSVYAERWRDTKDLDLYVRPADREAMIDVLHLAGLVDYHSAKPYDRAWIYRSFRDEVIVDVIWQMANRRATVDEVWLSRGPEIEAGSLRVRLLAPEELIWAKLYVVQRDRCDWPDLLNVLRQQGPRLDWEHLLRQVADDRLVLGGLMNLFAWMCPARATELPAWIWDRLGLLSPPAGTDCLEDRRRVRLIDSRDWFGPEMGEAAG